MDLSLCSENDVIEGAIVLWLPSTIKLKVFRNPWQRTYKNDVQAPWETNDKFCYNLQNQSRTYNIDNKRSTRLLDLIDASIFDFIISNGDRHHYELIDGSPASTILLLDNGKR